MAFLVFLPFIKEGKSFAWYSDGVNQFYSWLVYVNRTVREGVSSLLSGEGWTFPLFNFSNSIAVPNLQYGVLILLVALCPPEHVVEFHTVFVLFNYYLIGLSFLYFGRYFKQKFLPAAAGAISYTFCAFSLFAGVRHPFFLMPMILLPLLIIGTEKVMRRERSWTLTISAFLSITPLYGVYFSCMQAVFVFLYVCVRFFDLYREDRPRSFIRMWGRLFAWAGPGILLGCLTAIPALISILSGQRVGADIWEYTNPLLYDKKYYWNLLLTFPITAAGSGNWMYLGFSVLALPAVCLLFIRRKRESRALRTLFLILGLMHLIPAAAYVMSGFSNISNRFCFGLAFCVCAILMFQLPEMNSMSWREGALLGGVEAAYLVCFAVVKGYIRRIFALPLLCSLGVVFFCGRSKKIGERALMAVCLGITCFSVTLTAFERFDKSERNYVKQFYDNPQERLNQGQYSALGRSGPVAEDESFFRVAGGSSLFMENNFAFAYDLNGWTSYPYYGQSQEYTAWIREMEAPRGHLAHDYFIPVRQAHLLTLGNVKYYAARDSDQADWPYGFIPVDQVDQDTILENENWLPVGYTYDCYLSREEYDKLNSLEKRDALMQAVVLEDVPSAGTIKEKGGLDFSARQLLYTAQSDGAVWENGALRVEKKNASITLSFAGLPETETYLRIVGLDLTGYTGPDYWDLKAETPETSASGNWQTDQYVYASGQHNQLLDMGYSQEGMTSVTITFPAKGSFRLEDIQIWCQSMDNFSRQAAELRAESLENVETDWRSLKGTVSVSGNKILCVTLPWHEGWTAYVDGEETALFHANTGFMGLEVSEGEHTVELRYWMPGLTAGIILTGLGVVSCIVLACSGKRKKENM